MALQVPPPSDRKRVKVYELRDNDWFDRGTGFCTGQVVNDEPRIYVESEDEPQRMLLETKISKDDGYQKQQDTLIVWTESNGTDMALSFQEADGCAVIWEFVSQVQQQLIAMAGPDDALSDDAMESFSNPVMLPPPELGNLSDIEQMMRAASGTPAGRDSLARFLIREEYIPKLLPLVETAEDLESLPDLHRLCNIMKSLILLNDNTIIEQVVMDQNVIGVVGALEYDPDFPTHKANHRQYLSDKTRYKEVVPIKDPTIRRKIRHTWRLQYLKDVVLARILDDPTFSVLNSLIFFNQVDILQHLQGNTPFLRELFAIFDSKNADIKKKVDGVHFIHQCAAIAKNLQAPARASLFSNFIQAGLFGVITFAVKHPDPSLRTTGIDILVALLDHDASMMRNFMLKAVNEKKTPLTNTLIDLLHVETDLGVKNQLADAIKVLLDPQVPQMPDPMNRTAGDFLSKMRVAPQPNSESFVQTIFDESCRKLFYPLRALEKRPSMSDFTYQEVTLYFHLVDMLTFFVRQSQFRSKSFMHSERLTNRVAQLLTVPQKHLKLTALKFFRTCIALQDGFYNAQMTQENTFELILNIVYESMPRDNLLNSACLELFEFIKRENIKPIILHVVEKYRDKLKEITYVDTFLNLALRYDQMQGYNAAEMDATLFSQDEDALRKQMNGGQRWHGLKEADAAEEEYFNTSDDEDEHTVQQQRKLALAHAPNGGASPLIKALVDYPDDDDDIMMDARAEQPRLQPSPLPDNPASQQENEPPSEQPTTPTLIQQNNLQSPPERLSEKRRREEDDDGDELNKLSSLAGSGSNKRRSSSSSVSNLGSGSGSLRRRKNFLSVGKHSETNANSSPVLNTRQGNTAAESGGQQPANVGGGGGSKKMTISLSAHLALKGNGGKDSNKEGAEENDTT